MKILQVTNFFKPSFEAGGVARSAFSLSKYLSKNGHEITVYTTNRSLYDTHVETNKKVFLDGIEVYYFENLRKYLGNIPPLPYYSPFVARDQIKKFDVIHIHEHRTLLATVVCYYAIKYGIPYVIQPRGSIPKSIKSRQKSLFDCFFGESIISNAKHVIASSKIESEQYKDVFPKLNDKLISHIPNGIDFEIYKHLPKEGNFKEKHSVDSNCRIVLFLSRIHERKGADILIEAFKIVKNIYENVILIIAGPDDGYLDTLKVLVNELNLNEDILFTGPLFGNDKLEAYIDSDVFVLPSKDRYESFGNVALEACACGTPVVITKNCGVSEWITNKVGYVVECNANNIAESILLILNNKHINEMQNNCKDFAVEFNWLDIVKKYEIVYEDLL